MNDDRNRTVEEKDRDYYRRRAIQRKRHRELQKRRRKMVVLTVVAVILVLVLIITSVSCVGSCIGQQSDKSLAQTQAENQSSQSETLPATEATESPTTATSAKNEDGSVDPSYFDDAVFVGDSVTLSFSMYVESQRSQGIECLGDAYVLAAGSLGYSNSFNPVGDENCVLPIYEGVQQPIEDSIAQIGAKKVYIMLGINDIVIFDYDTILENAATRIGMIKDKSPDAQIYIESVTPILYGREYDSFTNESVRAFNERMKAFAEQNGYYYLDIYSVMADENGYLKEEYCSDPDTMGIHLQFTADAAWEEYLLKHPEG